MIKVQSDSAASLTEDFRSMLDSSRHFLETVLLAIGALLPIVDPLGGVPVYLQLTAGMRPETREPIAKLVALDSFLLLVASALFGTYVLDFFGLSIPDVQLGGGVVLCALAWSLLTGPDGPEALSRSTVAQVAAADWRPRAFYPLTMPITVGPGSISVALTLGAHHSTGIGGSIFSVLANTLGILVVAVAVYVCYRYATVILRRLGTTGAAVVTRLSAFLLLCIGVHIAWSGVHGLLASALPGVFR